MFTGIIQSIGTLSLIEDHDDDKRLTIDVGSMDTGDFNAGDSICVNGVCLTVVGLAGRRFIADISTESLLCTSLGSLKSDSKVNLEKSLQLGDRLHGHMVTGHVDGIGKILTRKEDARSIRFYIELPVELHRYVSKKGSICVDGVSLTVNDKDSKGFMVNIIPHTLDQTIFSEYIPGTLVNIEVDLIARYLETLIPKT
ncbi:MAG: riboflavin synthase [Gammaproteobacteria bacterium]|nr:riboflavin synthase [Gammaproteobacteria bacterium]NIN61430.1 riboflavin synthase [Gammaproteobacteria bacterium]NIO61197.1 riboflavin synthase [Gammaproteobacteria bacterium]NIP48869.1 riboflavin synthase [Gammaproteobacteria bacterium]NIQ09323.1 riboflavin synthase [Gammaproteobacteria bacterium]